MDDYVSSPDQFTEGDANLTVLCKNIGDTLERHYPGWLWAIMPEAKGGGVLSIISLRLSGEYGYRFYMNELQGDPKPAMQKVMRGAGEILERFGVPRGMYRYEDWVNSPRYLAMPVPDLSDKPHLLRKKFRDEALTKALKFGTVGLRVRDVTAGGQTTRHLDLRVNHGP